MATTAIPVISAYMQADTAASGNSVVQRDGSGNIVVAGATVSSLVNTGVHISAITTITAATTLTTQSTVLVNASGGAFAVTLPAAAVSVGVIYSIKKIDSSSNAVTVTGNGSELIDGSNTKVLSTQWAGCKVQSNGTSWFII